MNLQLDDYITCIVHNTRVHVAPCNETYSYEFITLFLVNTGFSAKNAQYININMRMEKIERESKNYHVSTEIGCTHFSNGKCNERTEKKIEW